jgi:hypothetical protein
MKPFNNQFATQKLRGVISEVKFTIEDSDLYSAVMDKYMRGTEMKDMKITDKGPYLETDEETFKSIQDIAKKLNKEDSLVRNNDIDETSTTSGAGAYLPKATIKKKTDEVKKKKKDVEPKLAAGPADIYMKKKWGWKEAPSIPNRPSKGGFQYKQIFEGEELNENYSRFKRETKTRTNEQQLHAAMRLAEKKIHEANRILEYTTQLRTELTETRVNKNTQRLMEKITRGIAEAYGKMKKLK